MLSKESPRHNFDPIFTDVKKAKQADLHLSEEEEQMKT